MKLIKVIFNDYDAPHIATVAVNDEDLDATLVKLEHAVWGTSQPEDPSVYFEVVEPSTADEAIEYIKELLGDDEDNDQSQEER